MVPSSDDVLVGAGACEGARERPAAAYMWDATPSNNEELGRMEPNAEVVVETLTKAAHHSFAVIGPVSVVTRSGSDRKVRLTVLLPTEKNWEVK
jgi:hypothetical protein